MTSEVQVAASDRVAEAADLQRINFLAPHGTGVCCGCWVLMVAPARHVAFWECNECGEQRDVVPPEPVAGGDVAHAR